MDSKSEQTVQTVTPVGGTKNHLKVPIRKLWQENIKPKYSDTNVNHRFSHCWRKYRDSNKDDNWDEIESPQFVDFFNPPDLADSFFNSTILTTSTPNPDHTNTKHTNTITEDDTLVASLSNFYLSDITSDVHEKTYVNNDDSQKQEKEKYVVHNASKVEPKVNVKASHKNKTTQRIGIVYPFTFDLRKKHTQEGKQDVKKILKDENKVKKVEKSNNCDKQIKKRTDLWKKPPFVPCLSRKKLPPPKSPPLRTASRAQERKRFDENIQEKNKQKEQMLQMAITAKKKQEEEEIALLRKQLVHKAQPVHKYKIGLPKINKRPLTDPVSPLVLKRRRRI